MIQQTTYIHRNDQGHIINLPVGKVVCVGRNYADHAAELNNPIPTEPLLFIKPSTALVNIKDGDTIYYPQAHGSCHFETEIAVLLKDKLTQATEEEVSQAIWGYGLALDLTLRDLQQTLKIKGHPWEKAKSFDGACPMSGFIAAQPLISAPHIIEYTLHYNTRLQQQGNTQHMLTPIVPLIAYMSHYFTLNAGDIILTGTPAGVGQLNNNDQLRLTLINPTQTDFSLCIQATAQ